MVRKKNILIKKNKDVICTNLDDEKIILNLKSNKYFTLNSTGSVVYELIPTQGITFEKLDEKLKEKFIELNKKDFEEIHNYIELLSDSKICIFSK